MSDATDKKTQRDPELTAMQRVYKALDGLSFQQRRRVVAWLQDKVHNDANAEQVKTFRREIEEMKTTPLNSERAFGATAHQ